MAKFNTLSSGTKTVNVAGGESFTQSPELELISLLVTSFADDSFYERDNTTYKRLGKLISVCDKQFAAKAIIFARTQFGMRSITHVAAAELAKHISGQPWASDFYKAVIYRPDDMMEILSYYFQNNKKLSNAMKKGFAKAFDKFDEYSLSKYRGEGKAIKLVDVANLVHPKGTERNTEALRSLVKGTLRSTDTWESGLTRAGQNNSTPEEKEQAKKEVWIDLVRNKKIKYFALLRNLRNIIEQAPEVLDEALAMLVDEDLIRKSLVLPFRYLSAYTEVNKVGVNKDVRKVLSALNKAVDISLMNVPEFDGETLVVLDTSGSMTWGSDNKSPNIIGGLFASVLCKRNNCDFMTFSDNANYHNINVDDSTMSIFRNMKFASGGTNFHSIFTTANRKYDRIIILSDMQGWMGYENPTSTFNKYKDVYGADPFIYSFDLKNYGTMMFPERNVFAIAGFSEKIFDVMKLMENNKNAFMDKINSIKF